MKQVYEDIVFLSGSEAEEALGILEEKGKHEALEYLLQWYNGDSTLTREELSAGEADRIYQEKGFIMSYNQSLGYIGLERAVPKEI